MTNSNSLTSTVNPFYSQHRRRHVVAAPLPHFAKLPAAPINGSPVPRLTSLYHIDEAGDFGDRRYPGNCGGSLIADLLKFYQPASVTDPLTGSGNCRDVCEKLGIYCWSSDLHENVDACDPSSLPQGCFEFCWIHPPYWRQKLYTNDPRDLSRTPTLDAFLERYRLLIANCASTLTPGGKLAILMGDYYEPRIGHIPLVYHTKRIAFELGLRQIAPDIIRFSHGASSSRKAYRSAFIPNLHDVCMVFAR